jgi:lipopolysaccharide transport system ATP-binding protein
MNQTSTAIRIENLSKVYRIGIKEEKHDTIGAAIFDTIKSPFRNYRKYRSLYIFKDLKKHNSLQAGDMPGILWALKNISFELKTGEALGVIGRNGAGKSTLLKILSRITDPTSGYGEIRGKVSSLLEVGTGFHPELTGRENVYLNGMILGMKKKEIDSKFDDIVAFSEIEKFLDTPVKRYSSGMRIRLAFSVAAHLEPEILIIDEVLAVGDSAFQKKCLNKMEGVAKEGRTVLFVSHNMGMISDLCSKCILLSNGQVAEIGETKEIVGKYLADDSTSGSIDLTKWSENRLGKGPLRILNLRTEDKDGRTRSQFAYGEPISFKLGIQGQAGIECIIGLSIRDALGHLILHFSNLDDKFNIILPASQSEIHMRLEKIVLNEGTYYLTIFLGDGFNLMNDKVHNCLSFQVHTATKGRVICRSVVHLSAAWDLKATDNRSEQVIELMSASAK